MSYWNNVTKVENGVVTERVNNYMDSPLEGTIDEVIAALLEEKKIYSTTHTNLRVDRVSNDDPYEDGYKFVLLGDRPATPKEIAAQAKEDAVALQHQKEWDLQQLKALQAKYGSCKQDCSSEGVQAAPGKFKTGRDV